MIQCTTLRLIERGPFDFDIFISYCSHVYLLLYVYVYISNIVLNYYILLYS